MRFLRLLVLRLTLLLALPFVAMGATGKLAVRPLTLSVVPGITDVVQVASGPLHVVGRRADGSISLFALPGYWGLTNNKPFPAALTGVTQVAACWHHGLALTSDGTVHSWGDPFNGATEMPAGLSNVVEIAAGASTSYGRLNNGRVVGWGDDSFRQRTPPASLTDAAAIAAGSGWGAALRSNGVLMAWGNVAPPVSAANDGREMVTIAGGFNRLLALRADGTVWSAADDVPAGLSNVIAIAAGYNESLALTRDGSLVSWPAEGASTSDGVSNVVSLGGGFSVLAVADVWPVFVTQPAGATNYFGSSLTLTAAVSGTTPIAVQWRHDGQDIPGETNLTLFRSNLDWSAAGSYDLVASNAIGVTASRIAIVSVIEGPPVVVRHPESQRAFTGQNVQLQALAEGTAPLSYQWRFNGQTIVGANQSTLRLPAIQPKDDGAYTVEVTNFLGAAGSSNAVVRVRPVATWGSGPTVPTVPLPLDLTNPVALAASSVNFLALDADGRAFVWGPTNNGATVLPEAIADAVWVSGGSGAPGNLILAGDGTLWSWAGIQTVPPPATTVPLVAAVYGGGQHHGLTTDGRVIRWGPNSSEVTMLTWSNVVQISAGLFHVAALQQDGRVLVDGFNTQGQLVLPEGLSNVVSIAAGRLFTLAIRTDGSVVAWGDNRYGQCTVPSDLGPVASVAGGDYTSYAVRLDGTVRAWGRNDFGQATVPSELTNVVGIAAGRGQAAALIGPPELRLRAGPEIIRSNGDATSFCIEVPTHRARTTFLEGSSDGVNWTMVSAVFGNGRPRMICDPRPTHPLRLYRVRSQ